MRVSPTLLLGEYMNYIGSNKHEVTVDGEPLDLCLDIANHSPTGFSWGYGGSGPTQLALAILVSEYGRNLDTHPVFYKQFKDDVIANLEGDSFTITSEDVKSYVIQLLIP